jgi:membrane protease YdiL (CAAX protease family)
MQWRHGARAGSFVLGVPVVIALWNLAYDTGSPDPDGAAALALDALATAALFALLALAGAALSDEALGPRLGLRRGRFDARTIAITAIGLLGLSHAVEGMLTLLDFPASPSLVRFASALSAASPAERALVLAVLALGSAGTEELFFRGLLQRGLEQIVGAAGAITITALVFSAAHGDSTHALATLPLGVYLGVLTWRDGSIRPALVAHAVNNALAVLEAGIDLGLPETGPITVVPIAAGLAIAALALRTAVRGAFPPVPATTPPA